MNLNGVLIDLHCHLDGSLPISLVRHLAKFNREVKISQNDIKLKRRLSVQGRGGDLNDYLKKFELPLSLLQNRMDLVTAARTLCNHLEKNGVMYAEIRFAPQLHTRKGLTQEEAVEAVIEGKNRSSLKSNLILCCMRGDNNKKENLETIAVAKKFHNNGVCAIDLAGAEALYKTNEFEYVFEEAIKNEIPMTIHCGEADGRDSVACAMEYLKKSNQKIKRFGHGIRILEDENLTKEAIENGFFFELCPTSNINTGMYETYSLYPVKRMLRKGMKVTLNTDNCTVSNTELIREYNSIIERNVLGKSDIKALLRNSVDASFADDNLKRDMYKKIDFAMEG